jgi:PST family polysaccharide transporter
MEFIKLLRRRLNIYTSVDREENSHHVMNLVWMFSDKAFKLISELFVGILVARYLGAESFGLLSFAISYITIFFGISSLGLSELLTRELFHYSSSIKKLIGSAFFLKIGISLILILLINGSAFLFYEDPRVRSLLFVVSLTILARSFDVIEYYFQSISANHKVAKIHITSNFIISLLKILFVVQQLDIIFFAALYSLEWFLNAIGLTFLYSRKNQIRQWFFTKPVAIYLLRNSWYLMLSALAVDLYMRMDQLMIREIINDSANGLYSAATKISEVWYAIPVVVGSVLFPAILKSKSTSDELFNTRILQMLSFMFWLSILISFIVAPFSKNILAFLFTPEYEGAASVLSIHIWASVFVFWGVTSTYWLLAMNLQSISLFRTVTGLFFNGVLNFILIPRHGIQGAAVATLISQSIASSFSLLVNKRTRPIFFLQLKSIVYPFPYIKTKFNQKSK